MGRRSLACLVLLCLVAAARPAGAMPITSVEILRSTGSGFTVIATGSTTASAEFAPEFGEGAEGGATAFATGTGLGGYADGRVDDTSFGQGGAVGGGFRVSVVWSDIMITGPAPTVETNVSALVTGAVGLTSAPGLAASANLLASVTMRNPASTPRFAQVVEQLSPGPFARTLTTDTMTVDLSQPVEVEMVLRLRGRVESPCCIGTGMAEFTTNFLNTMTFVTGQDVFELPEGFTANSVDGRIVDNRFVAIPEPGRAALVFAGVAAAWAGRRRRHT